MKFLRLIKAFGYLALGVAATWYGAASLFENHQLGNKFSPEQTATGAGIIIILIGLVSGFVGIQKLIGSDPSDCD